MSVDNGASFFADLVDRQSLIEGINGLLAARYPQEAEKGYLFKPSDLRRLLRPAWRKMNYVEFEVPKRSGGTRPIRAPHKRLKSVLGVLAEQLELSIRPHLSSAVVGFVGNRSIVDGARRHTGKRYVFNTDLVAFFGSVELHRIKACFKRAPFGLDGKREELAFFLANLCTVSVDVLRPNETGEWVATSRSVLPQGAPTSPVLSNVVCQRLDQRLLGLARKHGLAYTRYADDLTFSSDRDVFAPSSPFRRHLDDIIIGEGFRQNPKKVRCQRWTQRQMVTGLVVNERVNVTQHYLKEVRQWLYLWDDQDYATAQAEYAEQRSAMAGVVLVAVLAGKIDYLRMVDGGAVTHFEGVGELAEGETGEVTEVSVRHTRLNGWLNRLIARDAAAEAQEADAKAARTKRSGDHSEESGIMLRDDTYLGKLIHEEKSRGPATAAGGESE